MPLRARHVLVQLAVVVGLLAATNRAMRPVAADAFAARKLHAAWATTAPTLLVGSSVVDLGLDPAVIAAALPEALRPAANLGMHASTAAEHDQLLATAFSRRHRPKLVVWGYFGVELVRPVPMDFSSLVGRRAMAYYATPDVAGPLLATAGVWDRLTFRLARPWPLVTERAALWPWVDGWRWRIESIGMPTPGDTALGREADMRNFAEVEFEAADMDAFVAGRTPLLPAVTLGIDLARRRGARCVFVEMPLRPDFRREAMTPRHAAFAAKLANELKACGCETVSAIDWVDDPAGFIDEIHLNDAGRRVMSERLAAELGPPVPSPGTPGEGVRGRSN